MNHKHDPNLTEQENDRAMAAVLQSVLAKTDPSLNVTFADKESGCLVVSAPGDKEESTFDAAMLLKVIKTAFKMSQENKNASTNT